MKFGFSIFTAVSCMALIAHSVSAQPAQTPVAPGSEGNVAGDYETEIIAKEYAISNGEAKDQQAVVGLYQREAGKIAEQYPGSFLASIADYGKRFRITLVFDRDVNLPDVQQAVTSELRPFLAIRRSRFSGDEIKAAKKTILDLAGARFDGVSASFNFTRDRYELWLPEDADASAILREFPVDLRNIIDIKRGVTANMVGVDGNADTPTTSARTVYFGGWPLFSAGTAACTSSFSVWNTSTNTPGVLTAGHCDNTRIAHRYPADGTLVSLDDAVSERYPGWYDFQIHYTPGMGTNGSFWVDNDVSGTYRINCNITVDTCTTRSFRNRISSLAVPQYIQVVDAVKGVAIQSDLGYNPNHPLNAIRCRYGRMTGIVCGKIINSEVDGNIRDSNGNTYSSYSFVRVEPYTGYQATAIGGDSGGPVFTSLYVPASGSPTAIAAGVVSSARLMGTGLLTSGMRDRPCIVGSDTGCFYDYMPIDRINDSSYPIGVLKYGTTTYQAINVN